MTGTGFFMVVGLSIPPASLGTIPEIFIIPRRLDCVMVGKGFLSFQDTFTKDYAGFLRAKQEDI